MKRSVSRLAVSSQANNALHLVPRHLSRRLQSQPPRQILGASKLRP